MNTSQQREEAALAEINAVLERYGCLLTVGVQSGQTIQLPDGSLMSGQRYVVQIAAQAIPDLRDVIPAGDPQHEQGRRD